MADQSHVREPFASILKSILRPVPYPLPVEISTREQPKTRFHADDINDAYSVLLWYWPQDQNASNADERMREAFSRCMVALDAAMTRRIESDLDEQYRYELNRLGGGIAPKLHDSDSEPEGRF